MWSERGPGAADYFISGRMEEGMSQCFVHIDYDFSCLRFLKVHEICCHCFTLPQVRDVFAQVGSGLSMSLFMLYFLLPA